MASSSVFISYRRSVSGYTARAVFQDLRAYGIDAFIDIENIDSGQFETVILNQIAARPYFLIILGPGCLDRCDDPGDWLRLEIEHAVALDRIIIPLLTSNFDFNAPYAKPYLTGKLAKLPSFNALNVPLDYFEAAMERLRTRFLKPTDLSITPTPLAEQVAVQQKIEQAKAEPTVTEKQLSAQEYFERALARPDSDVDGIIVDYTEAIRLDPQYADAYLNRGFTRGIKGDLEGAIADLTEAIQLNPQEVLAYGNRGVARRRQGDLEGAIADYTEAIRLDPQSAKAYYNRGVARNKKGDIEDAVADYQQTLALDPDHSEAQFMRDYIAKHAKGR